MLICVLGLPGTGKSTLMQRLQKRLQADGTRTVTCLHPSKHARDAGLVTTQFVTRAQLAAIPGLTASFLAAIEQGLTEGDVIVDGFPRTSEQAQELLGKGWDVLVVHLAFDSTKEIELSVARQVKRVKDHGVDVPRESLEEQTRFALQNDETAIKLVLAGAPRVLRVDAGLSECEVESIVFVSLSPM